MIELLNQAHLAETDQKQGHPHYDAGAVQIAQATQQASQGQPSHVEALRSEGPVASSSRLKYQMTLPFENTAHQEPSTLLQQGVAQIPHAPALTVCACLQPACLC